MMSGEAYVLEFGKKLTGMMTAAVMVAAMAALLSMPAGGQEKKREYKDNAEYDIYNEVIKDVNAKNWAKLLTDLDTWKQKYPASDYSDWRDLYYVQAYANTKNCSKGLPFAREMMDKDLDKLYPDPKTGPGNVITILYTTLGCLAQNPNATPQELETIKKAAEMLAGYERKPEGMADAAWAEPKKQLKAAADATLLNVALIPGDVAMKKTPPDCQAAERIYTDALAKFPNSTLASYGLGRAWYCLARANNQEKAKEYVPKTLYEFARSIAIDPTLGGTQQDPKALVTSVTNIYTNYHGSTEGFEELKTQAKGAPMPPANFTIMTAYDIAEAKQKEFEGKYPDLAFWLKIKTPLTAADGEAYFASSVKETDLPKLKGTLVEGVPACRSKSLLVSFPEPGQQGAAPNVITLKLDAPLSGKPDTGGEIEFKGVPTAFTKEPFMLTLETEKANIQGLKTTPCVAAAPKGPAKKGVTKKK